MFATSHSQLVVVQSMNQSGRMFGTRPEQFVKLIVLALFCVCYFISAHNSLVKCQEQISSNLVDPVGSQKLAAVAAAAAGSTREEMEENLKYLEKLDKYYSEIARPRFGRSEYKQPNYQRRLAIISRQQQQQQPIIMNNSNDPQTIADLIIQSALEQRQKLRQQQYEPTDAY